MRRIRKIAMAVTGILAMVFLFAVIASACTKDEDANGQDAGADTGQGPVVKHTGDPCIKSTECSDQGDTCVEGYCSHPCAKFDDCPEDGFTCGLTAGGDLFCVPLTYEEGQGQECVISECAEGYDCFARAVGDQYAYCTKTCTTDRDCPPDMACRDANGEKQCAPRTWCEPCMLDDQCAERYDRCLKDDSGASYCSEQCDPEIASSCPPDAVCEAQEDGKTYCVPGGGTCLGDGSYCTPCRSNGDCSETGGQCYYSIRIQNLFCTKSCESDQDCPEEHACFYVDYNNPALGTECRPRSDSCQVPSDGMVTGDECNDFWNCKAGQCLGWASHDYAGIAGQPRYCTPDCNFDTAPDCGSHYLGCFRIDVGGGQYIDLCLPPEGWTGDKYKECEDLCPNGPYDCAWEDQYIADNDIGFCSFMYPDGGL